MRRVGLVRIAMFSVFAVFAAVTLTPCVVHAHAMRITAHAEGTTVDGVVTYVGHGPAPHVLVRIEHEDGTLLGETHTDDDGRFSFAAFGPHDHIIIADAGDGHATRGRISSEALPSEGPAWERAAAGAAPQGPMPPVVASPAQTIDQAALEEAFEGIVARQLLPIREQLSAVEDRRRVVDILGGIGYILGITGIGFYFKARQRLPAG